MYRLIVIACAALAGAALPLSLSAAEDKPPPKSVDKPKIPDRVYVKVSTTLGDMVVELYQDKAPITVKNFLAYVDDGFYEGTMFHRVIKDFMVQGGGMLPDYSKKTTKESIKNEADNGLKNVYGTLAMARTQHPDSASSQFFINVKSNAFLNHRAPNPGGWGYCVFGTVIDGIDTLEKIRNTPVKMDPRADRQKPAAPLTPVLINKVTRVDQEEIKEAVAAARAKEAQQVQKEAQQVQLVALETKKQAEQKAEEDKKLSASVSEQFEQAKEFVKQRGIDITKGQDSPTGVWYVAITEGTGATPKETDKVELHATGWLADGKKFWSSHDDGTALNRSVTRFVPGFREGLTKIKAGGTTIVVMPPELAYGKRGSRQIPPNAVLIFEIELLSIGG
jgi:cyclophilin family peptidyl-prolyl cis-trans isomerase